MKRINLIIAFCFGMTLQSVAQNAGYYSNYFCSDSLNSEELASFTQRATEKVYDFEDYIQLLLDEQMDEELRASTYAQTLRLFEPEAQILVCNHKKDRTYPAPKFLNRVKAGKIPKIDLNTEDISVSQPLTRSDKGYKGQLKVNGNWTFDSDCFSETVWISIQLKKVKKDFGNQQKEVWEVRFSEILWP